MALTVADITPGEECFTHLDDVTGKQTTYAVARFWAWLKAHEDPDWKFLVPVEEHHARYCVEARGVEQHRLNRLVETEEGRQRLLNPILFLRLADDKVLLLDGTHRYLAYYFLGMKQIPAYIVPASLADPFIVTDAEQVDGDTLLNSWSGL